MQFFGSRVELVISSLINHGRQQEAKQRALFNATGWLVQIFEAHLNATKHQQAALVPAWPNEVEVKAEALSIYCAVRKHTNYKKLSASTRLIDDDDDDS